jgi:3-oxoacyl-[acyl-carrier protein] reductase
VTGSGRNLGRAVALELARKGANVVVNTRTNADQAARVAAEIEALGSRALPVVADVGTSDGAGTLAQEALREFGGVDIFVSNAVQRQHKDFLELTPDEWNAVFGLTIDAPFTILRAVLPGMVDRSWGRVIFVAGYAPFDARTVGLAAAKIGLLGFCHAIARGYGKHGILANALSPGNMDTIRDVKPMAEPTFEQIPVPTKGSPEDFAKLAAFLCSDDNTYITGQTIGVNGGLYMTL